MSMISRIFQAVQSWRRQRVGPRTAKRAVVAMEQLDHRQLLAVNFTGNVATDFPVTTQPGVVDFQGVNTPGYQPPVIPHIGPVGGPYLDQLIKVSGFNISEIRVSYDSTDDTLNIGFNQPPSQNPGQPGSVMAGDADNNGNTGTVNPAVSAIDPGFQEYPGLGGPERMFAFLDLTGTGVPTVVAGFPASFAPITPNSPPKSFQVAQAVPNIFNPKGEPTFGTELPGFEGNVYLNNNQAHPNLEFTIDHFSQLYLQETGKALTPQSYIGIGAYAGSPVDAPISDLVFPENTFAISASTLPSTCEPASPPVLINPHSARHVNTAHAEAVRVTIVSSSGFDATQIDPATVRLGGATPYTEFARNFNHSDFPSETFVFRGYDISLPAGITPATVTGQLYDGTKFATTILIYNKNDSFYTPQQIAARDAKIGFQPPEELALDVASANAGGNVATINANILAANEASATSAETIPSDDSTYAPISSTMTPSVVPAITPSVVSIPKKSTKTKANSVSGRLAASMQGGSAGSSGSSGSTLTAAQSALAARDAALANYAS